MIERPEEIAKLVPSLEILKQGKGGLLHVSGPVGVGKSTLLEVLQEKNGQGLAWVWNYACSKAWSAPYGGLIGLLRGLWTITEDDTLEAIRKKIEQAVRDPSTSLRVSPAGLHLPTLFRLFCVDSPAPEIEESLPPEDFKAVTPRALKVEVIKVLESVLIGFCKKNPTVVVLDDAHEADALTLDFFESILPCLSETPLLIVLLSEEGSSTDLAHLIARAKKDLQDRFWQVSLGGFPAGQTAELLKSLLKGLSLEGGIRDLVLEQSNGNPLYLAEIASFLRGTTSAVFETHPSEVQLLDSLQAVITTRAGTLETGAKGMLRAASVLGPRFRRDLLEAVATETGNFRTTLETLLKRGFLFVSREGENQLCLRHPLVAEVIYRNLPSDQKTRLHNRVAKAVERLYPEKTPLFYEFLAHHYEAGQETPVALHYLKLAGDKAKKLGAFVEAMRSYDRGAELSEKDTKTQQELILFLSRCGDLWETSGNYQRALQDWSRVKDLAVERGNPVDEARADFRIGLLQRRLGHLDESILYHEKAQELFRGQKMRQEQAWNLCDMGMTHHVHGEYKRALRLFRDAYKAFHEIDHREGMAWCLYHVGMAYREMRQFTQALKVLEDAQRIFRELGHRSGLASSAHDISLCYREIDMPMVALDFARMATQIFEELELAPQLAWSYDNLSVIHRNLTNREQSLVYAQKAQGIFEKIGLADGLAWNLAGLGTTYLEMCNYPEAGKCFANSYELFKKLGNEQGMSWCQFSLGLVSRYQWELDEAKTHLNEALAGFQKRDLRDRVGWCLLNLAAVHRYKAEFAQAVRINQKALRLFSPLKMKDGVAWSLFQLGNACKDQGKFLRSWQLHREALKFHQDVMNRQGIAWGHNELGVTYYELDDPARAEESFKSAIDIGHEIEETPVIAEATLNMGILALDRGDLNVAEERFSQARKLGADVGVCRELGRLALLKGDLAGAQVFLKEAQDLIDKRGLTYIRCSLLNLVGELAYLQDDAARAKSTWQISSQLARRLGQKKVYIEALLALAQPDVQMDGDNSKNALKVLAKIHKFLRSMGSRRLKVKTLAVQGLAQAKEDPSGAETSFKQAARLLETLNLPALEMRLLKDLIAFHMGIGQEKEAQPYQVRLSEVSKRWVTSSSANHSTSLLLAT